MVENNRIFLAGVAKIPTASGTFYRGTSHQNYQLDQVVTIEYSTGISSVRRIGESFTDPHGSLLEIHTHSARSIVPYCFVDEEESILLPGVQLHVDSISSVKLDISGPSRPNEFITVPYVKLSEISE
jgi:hypothetical protein